MKPAEETDVRFFFDAEQDKKAIPCHELGRFVHFHFRALELVQFLSYVGFILGSQKTPRLLRLTIVIMRFGDLNVVAELDDLALL